MPAAVRPVRRSRGRTHRPRDRGAVDVSIQMLFGLIATLFAVLLVFETVSYWHAHNVLEEAASEGARVVAAFDGSCPLGVAAAKAVVAREAGSWARNVAVACTDGVTVSVAVSAVSPGVLGGAAGMRVSVVASAPKER